MEAAEYLIRTIATCVEEYCDVCDQTRESSSSTDHNRFRTGVRSVIRGCVEAIIPAAGDYRMRFGQFKGHQLRDVDWSYLEHWSTHSIDSADRRRIVEYLESPEGRAAEALARGVTREDDLGYPPYRMDVFLCGDCDDVAVTTCTELPWLWTEITDAVYQAMTGVGSHNLDRRYFLGICPRCGGRTAEILDDIESVYPGYGTGQ